MKYPRPKPVLLHLLYSLMWCVFGALVMYAIWQLLIQIGHMKQRDIIDTFTGLVAVAAACAIIYAVLSAALFFFRSAIQNINENYAAHLGHMEALSKERTKAYRHP